MSTVQLFRLNQYCKLFFHIFLKKMGGRERIFFRPAHSALFRRFAGCLGQELWRRRKRLGRDWEKGFVPCVYYFGVNSVLPNN